MLIADVKQTEEEEEEFSASESFEALEKSYHEQSHAVAFN